MTEQIATLGEPVTDIGEASLMQAEYGLLLNKLIAACEGTQPAVAIAAAISSAFCIAVDATPVESKDSAIKYLHACLGDAFASIEKAFEAKAGAEHGSDDTGEQGKSRDQEVVEG